MSSLEVATDWRVMFAFLCVTPLFAAYAYWKYLDRMDISTRKLEKAFNRIFLRHRNSSFATVIAGFGAGDKGQLGILTLFSDSLIFENLLGVETKLNYADIRTRTFLAAVDGQPPTENTRILRLETTTSTIYFILRPENERRVWAVLEYAGVGSPRPAAAPPAADIPAQAPVSAPRALPPLPPMPQK